MRTKSASMRVKEGHGEMSRTRTGDGASTRGGACWGGVVGCRRERLTGCVGPLQTHADAVEAEEVSPLHQLLVAAESRVGQPFPCK